MSNSITQEPQEVHARVVHTLPVFLEATRIQTDPNRMGEAPSWRYMWGAKVKMPCDMEDDVLEDAIKRVTSRLGSYDTEEWEKQGLAVRSCDLLAPEETQKRVTD